MRFSADFVAGKRFAFQKNMNEKWRYNKKIYKKSSWLFGTVVILLRSIQNAAYLKGQFSDSGIYF